MSILKKIFLPTFLIIISLNIILSGKVSNLKIFNFDYMRNGQKVRYPLRYQKISLEHGLENEEDINTFKFAVTWEFSNEDETKRAQEIFDDISNDMENTQITKSAFVMNFTAENLSELKLYKENEFGSSFIIEVLQKNNPLNLQIQILKDQPYRTDLHDLIVKVLEAKKANKFLESIDYETFRFLQ